MALVLLEEGAVPDYRCRAPTAPTGCPPISGQLLLSELTAEVRGALRPPLSPRANILLFEGCRNIRKGV